MNSSEKREQEKLAKFEARIARGETIEPGDWMPESYRQQLISIIRQHAHSEVVGMLPEGAWIRHAPNLRRKMVLLAKVQDEAGHGQYLYHAAETLGVTRKEMTDALLAGRDAYAVVFNYPTLTWADNAAIGLLVDGAVIMIQTMLSRCSYGPYARANIRICAEEAFHRKQGQEMTIQYANGTRGQQRIMQNAIDRMWWPTLMIFGPRDTDAHNTPLLLRWRIKLKTNDQLRQEFVDVLVPELHALGLTVPDPDLRYDEASGHWISSEVNWNEFWQVVRGNGPMNKKRIDARRKAHEDGRWVREAAAAYSQRYGI